MAQVWTPMIGINPNIYRNSILGTELAIIDAGRAVWEKFLERGKSWRWLGEPRSKKSPLSRLLSLQPFFFSLFKLNRACSRCELH
jgi:hypothetical protein